MKRIFLVLLGFVFFNSLSAQGFDSNLSKQLADRRFQGILKLIKISKVQEDSLYKLCLKHQLILDSALYFESNPYLYIEKCDSAAKKFDTDFFDILTNSQITEYLKIKGHADVQRKTDEKIETLKASGEYSDSELKKMREEIYDYLMLEKVVYTRDKYNISRQKENIFRLKTLTPNSLKEAESRRKLKHKGLLQQGKMKWKNEK